MLDGSSLGRRWLHSQLTACTNDLVPSPNADADWYRFRPGCVQLEPAACSAEDLVCGSVVQYVSQIWVCGMSDARVMHVDNNEIHYEKKKKKRKKKKKKNN